MIQLPGRIQRFVEALPFHVDGTAGGEVADPAAMDGQGSVGRRDTGIDVGADAFHAGFSGPLEAGLDAGGVTFGGCFAGRQETGLDGGLGAGLGQRRGNDRAGRNMGARSSALMESQEPAVPGGSGRREADVNVEALQGFAGYFEAFEVTCI